MDGNGQINREIQKRGWDSPSSGVDSPGEVSPAGFNGDPNDELFVELQLVTRRLRRVEGLLGRAALANPEAPAWPVIERECVTALAAITLAASVVPDADPERAHAPRPIQVRDLRLDPRARRVWFADRELALTRTELRLLGALATEPTRVYKRNELLETVWGYQAIGRTRTVDTHASRLRRKLTDAGAARDEWVVTHAGVGFALVRAEPKRDHQAPQGPGHG